MVKLLQQNRKLGNLKDNFSKLKVQKKETVNEYTNTKATSNLNSKKIVKYEAVPEETESKSVANEEFREKYAF